MTEAQRHGLERLFEDLPIVEFHHGDCRGADEEAHDIAKAFALSIVVHPPEDPKARAFCVGDEVRPPRPYLKRNADIVAAADVLIAAPASLHEVLRSGTWATVREARRRGKRVYIIGPEGELDV